MYGKDTLNPFICDMLKYTVLVIHFQTFVALMLLV